MTAIQPYAKAVISLVSAAIAAIVIALIALPEGAGLLDISTLAWFVIAAALGRSPNELTEAQEALSNPYGFPRAGRMAKRKRQGSNSKALRWQQEDQR